MQQAESLSLEQIECFLDGCQSVAFEGGNRSDKYALVESVLKRHHYADQKRSVKGLLRRYLAKLTGLSRAQLTRLIRVVGKMLRFYTLGRADEAAIDEVLAVEEYVFPFDGADVLQQREVHAC